MDVKAGIGIGTGLVALVGGLFAIDARYLHAKEGEQMEQRAVQAVQSLKVDIEEIRLKNELQSNRSKLSFLVNKSKLTPDEKSECDWLREQIRLQQGQLTAIQK